MKWFFLEFLETVCALNLTQVIVNKRYANRSAIVRCIMLRNIQSPADIILDLINNFTSRNKCARTHICGTPTNRWRHHHRTILATSENRYFHPSISLPFLPSLLDKSTFPHVKVERKLCDIALPYRRNCLPRQNPITFAVNRPFLAPPLIVIPIEYDISLINHPQHTTFACANHNGLHGCNGGVGFDKGGQDGDWSSFSARDEHEGHR